MNDRFGVNMMRLGAFIVLVALFLMCLLAMRDGYEAFAALMFVIFGAAVFFIGVVIRNGDL